MVKASVEQLNHKQVQKARQGRHLTLHLMQKVMRAFNAAVLALLDKEEQSAFVAYPQRQLFNYAKCHDPAWADPNEIRLPAPLGSKLMDPPPALPPPPPPPPPPP
ncbi:MAG: hypothetical protein NTW21_44710 [Verrucomicrobia bacterium]|nr:hypothetical protein [Verrucomicrobiota bacterium]